MLSGARSGPSASTTTAGSTSSSRASRPHRSDAPGPCDHCAHETRRTGARREAVGWEIQRVCALDDDDLVDRRLAEAREHGRQEEPLLRRAEARRLARGQHHGGDGHQPVLTVTLSTTTGWDGGPVSHAEGVDPLDGVHALGHLADDRVVGRKRGTVAR